MGKPRKAGVPPERIDEWRQQASANAQNPQNQEQAADVAMKASWWTLFGVMLSMAAAAIGGYLGSGPRVVFSEWPAPQPRLFALRLPAASERHSPLRTYYGFCSHLQTICNK